MIDVTGQSSLADYRSAQFVHLRPRPWLRYTGVIFLPLVLAMLVVPLFSDFAPSSNHTGALVMLGLVAYLAILFFVYLPWRFRRLYLQQKALHAPFRFQVTEAGVTATSSVGQVALPWSHFHKWKEGKTVFLLYYSDALFTVVPKRFSGGQEELVMFWSLLNANVKRAT